MNPAIHDYASGSDADPPAEPSPNLGRVLLIEDDPIIQGLVAMSLQKAGYQVRCADDGEKGSELLGSDHFDLLITDNNLPKLTGVGLIRQLRATDHQMPILLISGQIPWQTPDLEKLLSPGMALEKPFAMARLVESVRSLMHAGAVRSG